jgi:hypothetical protein
VKARKTIGLLLIVSCSIIGTFANGNNVSAEYYSYNDCMNASGGRDHIYSVEWACSYDGGGGSGGQACTAWLGPANDSKSTTILVNESYSETITIAYWGMCTNSEDTTSKLYVEGDNGSIAERGMLTRGLWGDPNALKTTLNIEDFINGASYEGNGKYTRTVSVHRCNGSNPNSCSGDNAKISIIIKTTYNGYSGVIGINGSEWTDYESTGWQHEKGETSLKFDNCNNGCNVYIYHGLKRTQGDDSTEYKVTANEETTTSGRSAGDTPSIGVQGRITTGDYICSSLKFGNEIMSGNIQSWGKTTACAYADGIYGPKNGWSSSDIDIKTSKNSSEDWTDSDTYVKPTDEIHFKGTYTPKAQAGASKQSIGTLRVNENDIIKCNKKSNTLNYNIQNFFDSCNLGKWNNAFSIYLSGNTAAFSDIEISNDIGDTSSYNNIDKNLDHTYEVNVNDVGNIIYATAKTNYSRSTKYSPKSVSFSFNKNLKKYDATVDISPIQDSVKIKTPYNFTNTTNLNEDFLEEDNALVAYAGEEKSVTLDINVGQRTNIVTDGTYATIVRDAKWRLKVCYTADTGRTCSYTNPNEDGATGTLNETGNLNGTTDTKKIKFNVPDLPAGSSITIQTEVYPKDSYSDTNLKTSVYNPNDPNSWATSSEYTLTIAKKPSLQVWGGNIYTSSEINTATATKKHLNGYNEYSIEGDYDGKRYVFGSWGELGLISSGSVSGFSSGAALGYASQLSSDSGPGGGTKSNICLRSPLTFANFPCNSQFYQNTVGKLGNSNAANNASDQRTMIKNKMASSEEETAKENITLDDEVVIKKGETKVYYTTKDVNIKKDLIYEGADSGGYATLEDMPKLVIYAEGDINISCDVNRIDGLLIAEGKVNTCAGSDGTSPDVNSLERSNQLTINGAIIAKKLLANRTYGAATGANSIIPAEIINFDPTLYLFGNSGSGENKSSSVNFDVTYTKELAPRL